MARLRPLPAADKGSNKSLAAVKILKRRIGRLTKFWAPQCEVCDLPPSGPPRKKSAVRGARHKEVRARQFVVLNYLLFCFYRFLCAPG